MTPTEQGRHCAVCEKVVVDFTTMTEAELKAYFSKRPAMGCGSFRPDQLRTYTLPTEGFRIGWRPALAAIGLGLSAVLAYPSEAVGQIPSTHIPTTSDRPTQYPKPENPSEMFRIVGQVIGQEEGNWGLAGVTVGVMDKQIVTWTDQNGKFELPIPAKFHHPETVITFNQIGYTPQEYTLAELQQQIQSGGIQIRMLLDYEALSLEVSTNMGLMAYTWDDYLSVDHWITRGWNWLRWTLFKK